MVLTLILGKCTDIDRERKKEREGEYEEEEEEEVGWVVGKREGDPQC